MSSATPGGASSTLYEGLVDDAAMFPPRMADLETALSERHARQGSPCDRYVGSLLVPAGRAADLLDALGSETRPAPVSVGVIAADDTAAAREATELLKRSALVDVALVEIRLDPGAEPQSALAEAASAAGARPGGAEPRVLCEIPHAWLDDHRLADAATAASNRGLGAKLRTGGTAPEAFPAVEATARFIAACVKHGVAFKCTAGLHHAVRHRDLASGLTCHGFANILLATHLALGGAPTSTVAEALDERRPGCVAGRLSEVDAAEAASIRRRFLSYGSCDTATPVADIVNLLAAAP